MLKIGIEGGKFNFEISLFNSFTIKFRVFTVYLSEIQIEDGI